MSNLINLIKSIPGMIWDAVLWIFENIGNLISWVFFTIYDGLLTVLYSFAAAIDFSAVMFNAAAQYSSMPSQLIWLINQIGLPQGRQVRQANRDGVRAAVVLRAAVR